MEITGKSKIVFVLAHPVGHVRASHFFNTHFRSVDVDAAAVPLHVLPEDLEQMIRAIARMQNVAGFGVTVPHKIAVIPWLDDITATAKQIGAVNFVRREASGRLVGDNIDGAGFISGLHKNGFEPAGKTALMIGAGGAGRAVGFALSEAGVPLLHIVNRNAAKAEALAADIQAAYPHCAARHIEPERLDYDLIVNTTSLGMKPDDDLPHELENLASDSFVTDIIVNPLKTRFLEQAEARGCRILNGVAMLDAQMDLASRHMQI